MFLPTTDDDSSMDLRNLSIDAARSAVADGKTSATALAESFYAKIESDDPKIGA
jgi:Asp-tRNA(Asn)/Glu-tRNA(Gln) amidotransferase A subunit family amidase